MRYFVNIQLPNFAFFLKPTEEYLNFQFYYQTDQELKYSDIRASPKHLVNHQHQSYFSLIAMSTILSNYLTQLLFLSYYHLNSSLLIKSMSRVLKFILLNFLEHTNIEDWLMFRVLIFFLLRCPTSKEL